MYIARSSEPIPYVLIEDTENEVRTRWFMRAQAARAAQAYQIARKRAEERAGIPPEQMAEELAKLDNEYLAGALAHIENFETEGDQIEDPVQLRQIIADLDLPTRIELVLMSHSTMRLMRALRAVEKNS